MTSVGIVGAGAMGGMVGARLAAASMDVRILEVAPELVDAIRERGLAVEGAEPVSGRVRVSAAAAELGPVDVLFFFVKAHHTTSAARSARALCGPSTVVATLQNGWGSADVLADVFDRAGLVVGVTYHSATVTAPGRIAHTGRGATFIGPYVEGGGLGASETVAGVLRSAGIDAQVVPAVRLEIWRKLVLNAAALPVSALTGLRAGELAESGPTLELVDAVAAEAVAVARALGHPIELAERIERIHATLAGAGKGKPSMLQDAEARRPTEIDVINGAVVRYGEAKGVDVRANRALVALVKGLERSWAR